MKIGLLIIAHSCIGDELLHTAEAMLGVCPLNVTTIMVPTDFDTDTADAQAMDAIDLLDQGKGVLVLTVLHPAISPIDLPKRGMSMSSPELIFPC